MKSDATMNSMQFIESVSVIREKHNIQGTTKLRSKGEKLLSVPSLRI